MDVFEWDERYLTGEAVIDKEHHGLVNLINRLFRMRDENASMERLEPIFDALVDYAGNHFRHEEVFMSDVGCDPRHVTTHTQAHREFVRQLTIMRADFRTSLDVEIVLQFLIGWLVHHIMGTDQIMVKQVHSIRNGSSPAHAYDQEEPGNQASSINVVLTAMQRLCDIALQRNHALKEEQEKIEDIVQSRTRILQKTIQFLEEKARQLEAKSTASM
ncbi:bacteriohemerythrin [Uliginosibacterium gangwonense]|uniref:bacteriohemerythrin n=1 Tax=Uliginosibacterium gangwonense TaxID=392736 RepID=UPI00036548DD|nr:bacteriohemerythrin [Uliginosibacterium gangwonense]